MSYLILTIFWNWLVSIFLCENWWFQRSAYDICQLFCSKFYQNENVFPFFGALKIFCRPPPANVYLFKVNYGNLRKRCGICDIRSVVDLEWMQVFCFPKYIWCSFFAHTLTKCCQYSHHFIRTFNCSVWD